MLTIGRVTGSWFPPSAKSQITSIVRSLFSPNHPIVVWISVNSQDAIEAALGEDSSRAMIRRRRKTFVPTIILIPWFIPYSVHTRTAVPTTLVTRQNESIPPIPRATPPHSTQSQSQTHRPPLTPPSTPKHPYLRHQSAHTPSHNPSQSNSHSPQPQLYKPDTSPPSAAHPASSHNTPTSTPHQPSSPPPPPTHTHIPYTQPNAYTASTAYPQSPQNTRCSPVRPPVADSPAAVAPGDLAPLRWRSLPSRGTRR